MHFLMIIWQEKNEGNKTEGNKATGWDSNPQLSHSYILFCPTFFYFFCGLSYKIVLQFRVWMSYKNLKKSYICSTMSYNCRHHVYKYNNKRLQYMRYVNNKQVLLVIFTHILPLFVYIIKISKFTHIKMNPCSC